MYQSLSWLDRKMCDSGVFATLPPSQPFAMQRLFLLSMTVTHAAPGLDTSSGAAAVEPGEDKKVHEAHPSLPRNVIR
jgi:hypothetical protein